MRIRDVEGKIIKAGDEIYFIASEKKETHEVFEMYGKLFFRKKHRTVTDHEKLVFLSSDDLKVFKIIDNK